MNIPKTKVPPSNKADLQIELATYPSPNSNLIQFLSRFLSFVNFKHDLLSISLMASIIRAEFLPVKAKIHCVTA